MTDTPGATCPKDMRHGPCGGVRSDGGCEVDARPCPFVGRDLVRWTGPSHEPRSIEIPRFVVDFRPSLDHDETVRAAQLLGESAIGLLGEHLDDPPELRPVVVAERVVRAGLPVIATMTARDRSADDCDEIVRSLTAAGVSAIHCVTGDHPAARFSDPRHPAFALDALELAALARRVGDDVAVTVAESPASPPVALRPGRVAEKQRAGADAIVLNHGGGVDVMVEFARRCREAGAVAPMIAPVPVITDRRSANALTQFPGLVLPAGHLAAIVDAEDPRAEGIRRAVQLGVELLASGEFASLNLSGSAGGTGLEERCTLMAVVMAEIDERVA